MCASVYIHMYMHVGTVADILNRNNVSTHSAKISPSLRVFLPLTAWGNVPCDSARIGGDSLAVIVKLLYIARRDRTHS